MTLSYYLPTPPVSGSLTRVEARFWPGQWFTDYRNGNRATRQDVLRSPAVIITSCRENGNTKVYSRTALFYLLITKIIIQTRDVDSGCYGRIRIRIWKKVG